MIRGAGTIPTATIPTLTIPTRTIPTATIPTSLIIVGLLSAYWRSPAPRSTCGTGKDFARLQGAEARWGSQGEAPRSRSFNAI